MNIRNIAKYLLLLSLLAPVQACIEKEPEQTEEEEKPFIITGVEIPTIISVEHGQDYVFVVNGKGPADGDEVVFTPAEGAAGDVVAAVKAATDKSFAIVIPSALREGYYSVKVRRGEKSFTLASSVQVKIIISLRKQPSASSTVYGLVLCGSQPVKGVAVSDGYEVVRTDSDGFYEFRSEKASGFVFIETPSGYVPEHNGVLNNFWQKTTKAAAEKERLDFYLEEDGDQTNHTILFLGDMHLAARTNDRSQFSKFVSEVNDFTKAHKGEKIYGITLGDMTWDLYWYSQKYGFEEYLKDANGIKDMRLWHTIGNHDHDMNATGDWDTVVRYKDILGPNYYSFNIGNVHYVVLDNIECTNATASQKDGQWRTYVEQVVSDDLAWLAKDLKGVSKDTPVVVTMHASLFDQDGKYSLRNGSTLASYFDGYSNVTFVTGHTHKMWTVDRSNVHEFNSGAICAAWWWAGYYTPTLNIAQDGAPGGYRVMSVSGKEMTSRYKGTGRADDYQFRTYDRNEIKINPSEYAGKLSSEYNAHLTKYGAYNTASSKNQVIINVWDWNPRWKVEVKENGKDLAVSKTKLYDPLYLVAYSGKRYGADATPSFNPFSTSHMFTVTASGPSTTLEITVTDDEGRVYRETMTRPKAFSIDTYK